MLIFDCLIVGDISKDFPLFLASSLPLVPLLESSSQPTYLAPGLIAQPQQQLRILEIPPCFLSPFQQGRICHKLILANAAMGAELLWPLPGPWDDWISPLLLCWVSAATAPSSVQSLSYSRFFWSLSYVRFESCPISLEPWDTYSSHSLDYLLSLQWEWIVLCNLQLCKQQHDNCPVVLVSRCC